MQVSRIELLTFDLDDTLWPCKPTINAAENTLYEWMQRHVPVITSRYDSLVLREKRLEFMRRRPEVAHDMSRLRIESLHALCDEIGCEHDWVDAAFEVFYEARQKVRLYDDVAPALDRLAGRYRLAAVSNGNADIVMTGVSRWFEFAVSAADVGQQKPHAAVFETAMRKAGVAPAQTVHIGDDEHRDIFGASEAGIRAIWVNRSGKDWRHDGCDVEHHIRDLSELPAILRDMDD
jgi:FMN hydrolase / 5-amino-6-(5-phospho-D-ribitylamino)uracil phosphatase